jgi:hypothetical protein
MTFTPEAREPAVLTVLPAHDTAYRLTVLNGEVEITYGKETRVLKQGGYAFVPAAYRDKIQLKASANAEVMRLYEPSTSEALLYAGYDVRRNDVERIRVEAETRKAGQLEPLQVHLLVSKKAFISKPNISYDGPGSYSYERGLLKELSSGGIDITAVEDTNTDILTGNLLDMLSKKKAGVSYVVQLTKDEWNALKQRGEIATALAGTKIMALPELPARRARGLPFIREIEAGGVRLGLTDINALNDPTSSDTLALKAIMARLTGNRDITADMLRDLFATPNENPDPGAFAERIQRLIRSLLITMPARAYETDKELEGRRKLLWSV